MNGRRWPMPNTLTHPGLPRDVDADFLALPQGGLWLLAATTPDAYTRLARPPREGATWWGDSLVVEPRYLADLVAGLRAEGWEVAHG